MYAHLNNTVYAQLFDSIINTWLINECGMDPFSHNNEGHERSAAASASGEGPCKQVAIMVNSYCDYFASVGFPDVLELGLRVVSLGKSSVVYEVGVFKEGDEQVKVVGGYMHVWLDRPTWRPAPEGMEPRVRKALERLIPQSESKL